MNLPLQTLFAFSNRFERRVFNVPSDRPEDWGVTFLRTARGAEALARRFNWLVASRNSCAFARILLPFILSCRLVRLANATVQPARELSFQSMLS